MSAVLHPGFGDPEAIRSSQIANATFNRAQQLGYGKVVAQSLARRAKQEAAQWETPREVAMRMVPLKTHSATVRGRGPFGGNAA
mgnify:FL=1